MLIIPSETLASLLEPSTVYNKKDAMGFIILNSLRLRIEAMLGK